VGPAEVREHCTLDDGGRGLRPVGSQAGRRSVKLARTIADLEGVRDIPTRHRSVEAMQ
jgi:hypothetical protein